MVCDVSCSICTFASVLEDVSLIPIYDRTLERCDVLENSSAGALVYTSYRQQTRLVAPRDFCVRSVKVMVAVDPPEILDGVISCPPTPGRLPGAPVFMQSNVSCDSPLCPITDNRKRLVRGAVHVFGYIAWAVAAHPLRVRVENYCCVDAGGYIPKWVTAAAVRLNCEKLARLSALAEDSELSRASTEVAEACCPPGEQATGSLSSGEGRMRVPQTINGAGLQSESSCRIADPSRGAEALASVTHADSPSSPLVHGSGTTSLPCPNDGSSALTSGSIAKEESPWIARGEVQRCIQRISALARASGWRVLHDDRDYTVSELARPPVEALDALGAGPADVGDSLRAVRVSTRVACTLAELVSVAQVVAFTSALEPELVRDVFRRLTPLHWQRRGDRTPAGFSPAPIGSPTTAHPSAHQLRVGGHPSVGPPRQR